MDGRWKKHRLEGRFWVGLPGTERASAGMLPVGIPYGFKILWHYNSGSCGLCKYSRRATMGNAFVKGLSSLEFSDTAINNCTGRFTSRNNLL